MGTEHEVKVLDIRTATLAVTSPRSSVAALVSRPAVSVEASTPIDEAARTMRREQVSSLLVDGGDAIITERDLARGVAAGCDTTSPVSTLATPHPLSVDASTSVVRAAEIMLNQELRHLLVALPDDVVGVVSLRDIVAVLLQFADPHLWLSSLRVSLEAPPEVWIG